MLLKITQPIFNTTFLSYIFSYQIFEIQINVFFLIRQNYLFSMMHKVCLGYSMLFTFKGLGQGFTIICSPITQYLICVFLAKKSFQII
jgi:hypothetical protein